MIIQKCLLLLQNHTSAIFWCISNRIAARRHVRRHLRTCERKLEICEQCILIPNVWDIQVYRDNRYWPDWILHQLDQTDCPLRGTRVRLCAGWSHCDVLRSHDRADPAHQWAWKGAHCSTDPRTRSHRRVRSNAYLVDILRVVGLQASVCLVVTMSLLWLSFYQCKKNFSV